MKKLIVEAGSRILGSGNCPEHSGQLSDKLGVESTGAISIRQGMCANIPLQGL
jgi:hypothetical protein